MTVLKTNLIRVYSSLFDAFKRHKYFTTLYLRVRSDLIYAFMIFLRLLLPTKRASAFINVTM